MSCPGPSCREQEIHAVTKCERPCRTGATPTGLFSLGWRRAALAASGSRLDAACSCAEPTHGLAFCAATDPDPLRIGDTGVDEYFLDPKPVPSTSPQVYADRFTARRSGEIFLYVNDAVIGLPWLDDWLYRGGRHRGKAKVTVRLL